MRRYTMKQFKNILVATDFSQDSRAALDEAVLMAEKFKAKVYVLHAVDKIQAYGPDYFPSMEEIESVKSRLLSEARKKLEREVKRVNGKRGVAIIPDLRYGRAYDEILHEESEKNIDLLVMGTHAKNTLWQKLSRHLSDKLARQSICDTLIVRHSSE